MDTDKVDLLLEYVLAVARRAGSYAGELGPIHLIKYVYIGDLAFAERHGGQTYTGAAWQFYHYGPWALAVFKRIDPVVKLIGATEVRRPSNFSDEDFVRYVFQANDDELDKLILDLERKIPVEPQLAIRRAVKQYGAETSHLLDYVYKTDPMLHAAPNEYLDFGYAVNPAASPVGVAKDPEIPYKEQKRRKERLSIVRDRVAQKLEAARAKRAVEELTRTREPSIEEAAEVAQWLSTLADGPMDRLDGEVEFSDGIWKSPGRWESFDK